MNARPNKSDFDKALEAAKQAGLTRYRVIKRGREVVLEVDETESRKQDEAHDDFHKAVGAE